MTTVITGITTIMIISNTSVGWHKTTKTTITPLSTMTRITIITITSVGQHR